MMQLGQAAGNAAAIAVKSGVDLPDVPPDQLQAALRDQHVELDWPRPAWLVAYLKDE
jgi:hypothetical protein